MTEDNKSSLSDFNIHMKNYFILEINEKKYCEIMVTYIVEISHIIINPGILLMERYIRTGLQSHVPYMSYMSLKSEWL